MIWYTSDLHFGHRLVAGHRGFGEDTVAHDAEIVEKWNAVVGKDDIVHVLGDLAVSNPTYALALMADLPGRKRLIFGNHEPVHPMYRDAPRLLRKYPYDEVFEWAAPFARRKINGRNVLLSHFPYAGDHTEKPRYAQYRLRDMGEYLLHGHTHSTEVRTSDREVHVGWDAWRRLVPESEIAAIIEEG